MKNLSEINTNTIEGRYLMAALAAMTVSPSLMIHGEEVNGRNIEPDTMLSLLKPVVDAMYQDKPIHIQEEPKNLYETLVKGINKFNKENGSNTPDFVLAVYLNNCLNAFDEATQAREKWYSKALTIGGVVDLIEPIKSI